MECGDRGDPDQDPRLRGTPPARGAIAQRPGPDRYAQQGDGRPRRQPLGRRQPQARAVAGVAAQRLPRRQAGMADADRRRRAWESRGQELGVARRRLFAARLPALSRVIEPGRQRRRRHPRVRPDDRPIRGRRFHHPRGQEQRHLGRPGHLAGRPRRRRGDGDPLGLSARRQGMAAGDAVDQREDCRGRQRGGRFGWALRCHGW